MQVQYVKPFNKINKHPLEKNCLKSQRAKTIVFTILWTKK